MWFPVPGMYGGFDITLRQRLSSTCKSWCRVVGGSGQAHLITHAGAVLVDEGFVWHPRAIPAGSVTTTASRWEYDEES